MEWQLQLIDVYLTVCRLWAHGVASTVQRHSNNAKPILTDEEVATIYLFGVMKGHVTVQAIYQYANDHLREWFPRLAGYDAFGYRLNRISNGFVMLCEKISEQHRQRADVCGKDWVVDSLPIVMAGAHRSGNAKVAKGFADKGYCSSKNLWFHGLKLHCVALLQAGTLPMLFFVGSAPASAGDHPMFEQVAMELCDGRVFADKAYGERAHKSQLQESRNIKLFTPIKKPKGLLSLPGPDVFSSWVSSMRQPIESLFGWLQEKSKIQNASKVRSAAGLIVHTFGKIAACLMLLTNS